MGMTVKVGKIPGQPIKELDIDQAGGCTVQKALEIAGIDSTGYEVRKNNKIIDLNSMIEQGDVIIVVRKIQGNT